MCIFRAIILPDEYCLSLPTANPTLMCAVLLCVFICMKREPEMSFVRPNNVLLFYLYFQCVLISMLRICLDKIKFYLK